MKAKDLIIKACVIVQSNKLVLNIINLSKIITINLNEIELPHFHHTIEVNNIKYSIKLSFDEDDNELFLCIDDVDSCDDTIINDFIVIGSLDKFLFKTGYIVC